MTMTVTSLPRQYSPLSRLTPRVAIAVLMASGLLTACGGGGSGGSKEEPVTPVAFNFVEGTVEQLHQAIVTGGTTCHDVVQGYMDRIAKYDDDNGETDAALNPALNSVIAVSPTALAEADALDAEFKKTGKLVGPMHCVTVLPKDNIDTDDMPTTAGSAAMITSQPETDAYIVKKIRDAGGIIIGKANLDEFAFGFQGNGTHPNGGQVKNAYDQTRGPGGSSSGTGAAIAASFAMVGIGTDTGGSVRVPSSVEGLVGIRPSLRLVSQHGIIPLAPFQDTAGPMCRTVQDCALLLNAMVGFDASPSANHRKSFERTARPMTSADEYQRITNAPDDYTAFLDPDALKGARIGVVRALFGSNTYVNSTVNAAIEKLKEAGATVEDVVVPDLSTITSYSSVSSYEFKSSLTAYLSMWSNINDGHYMSYDEILASGKARSNFGGYNIDLTNPTTYAAYVKNTDERNPYVRPRITRALDNVDADGKVLGEPYDVLLYPSIQGLASTLGGSPSTGSNNRLSPFSGFPAMSIPAGMVEEVTGKPLLPVGMEMLAREFDEPTLISLGYAWQQHAQPRQAPTFTPEL